MSYASRPQTDEEVFQSVFGTVGEEAEPPKKVENFADIPDYGNLPPRGRGPGYQSDGLLDLVKMETLVGQTIGITGFLMKPSIYADADGGEKEYAQVEVMLPSGKYVGFQTSSQAVCDGLERRWELGQIPFKARIVAKTSRTGRVYHTLAAAS